MSADELAAATMQVLTDWRNAGANDQLVRDSIDANQDWETFLPTVAARNRQIFGDALFPDDWENDPQLTAWADDQAQINLSTLLIFVSSEWNGDERPENLDGYERYITVNGPAVEIDTVGDSLRQLEIPYIESDNANRNYAPDDLLASTGPISGTYSVGYVLTPDGKEQITYGQITELD